MTNYPFSRAIVHRHYSLETLPEALIALGQHCLQAIYCKLGFLKAVHPSHLTEPLPPSQLTHLVATRLCLYDHRQLLHALGQVYLRKDYKSLQQMEKDITDMLQDPQEQAEESSESGQSFLDDEAESQERYKRRKRRKEANLRVAQRQLYNKQLQSPNLTEVKQAKIEEKKERKEEGTDLSQFFKKSGSAKAQLNFFWQLVKTDTPVYTRRQSKDTYFVQVNLKVDNYYTAYCPKQFKGEGKSHSLKEAENAAATQLLTALFTSHPQLLPNFLALKQQRNLK